MDENAREHKGGERIAKVIARAGLGSRREAEAWIVAGRVAVNGTPVASPALNVSAGDAVTVDGNPLPVRERTRLFLYNKPRGLMTTRVDPQGRPTIFARLPKHLPRLVSVGRLDFNTEGLLLLTNDGALARVLELPATGWLRRYRVRAHGAVTQQQLDKLRTGITVNGVHYGAIEANIDRVQGSNLWLTFAIREGKNREVRNVLGELGLTVTRLIRVSFGPFQLAELPEGAVEEVRTRVLREQLGARLVAASGVDFSVPAAKPPPSASASESSRPGTNRKQTSHSWRAPDEDGGRKLRRKFHGTRRQDEPARDPPPADVRQDVTTDRKGRRIAIERRGTAPAPESARQPPHEATPASGRHRRSRGPDRAAGPRPSRPRAR